jgi:hypothetical protein
MRIDYIVTEIHLILPAAKYTKPWSNKRQQGFFTLWPNWGGEPADPNLPPQNKIEGYL